MKKLIDWFLSKKRLIDWIKAAGLRAIKTVAQTAVSFVTIGSAFTEIDWGMVISVAAVAGIYSLLTSIGGLPELENKEYTDE